MKYSLKLRTGDPVQWHAKRGVYVEGVFLEYFDEETATVITHKVNGEDTVVETNVKIRLLSCINS